MTDDSLKESHSQLRQNSDVRLSQKKSEHQLQYNYYTV